MLKSYLRIALRSLMKSRINAAINIVGLSLGLAAAIVIVVFANYELTYDHHHPHADNTYMVYKERLTPSGVQPTYDTWLPLADRLLAEFPEIVSGTRIIDNNISVEVNQQRFEEYSYYVDDAYFEMFAFPLAIGNHDKPFANLNSVVISEEIAEKYFGDRDPLGQEITVNFDRTYSVSGVMQDFPGNTFLDAEILFPIESVDDYGELQTEWGRSFLLSFVRLGEQSTPGGLEQKFPGIIESIWDAETAERTNFKLLPLLECYDTFVGDSRDSYALLYIALGILLIAVFNFMNLSTARSLDRAKEIGMRKVLGAGQKQLIAQFMMESVIMSMVALCLGLLIAGLSLPFINGLFDMELSIPLLSDPLMLPLFVAFGIAVGLLAGSYPALFMSRIAILDSLGSRISNRLGGLKVRNVLVVLQFSISIVLIVGAVTIGRQIGFMKSSDLAFNKENLVVVPVSEFDFEDREEARIRLATFRNELTGHPGIIDMTSSRHVPGRWSGSNTFVRPEGWQGNPLRMRYTYMDANFFDAYDVQLTDGTGFHPDSEGDQRESVVINAAALRAFGWENIEGKAVMIGDRKINVVGLIADFNYESLRTVVEPILHFHRIPSNATHRFLTLRTSGNELNNILAFLESQWTLLDESRPFNYFFVDEDMAALYANEDRLLTMVKVFSFLSIFISCLGLYGLLAFILEKRRKEIGIKKVLGASTMHISLSISNEFTRLVVIAVLLASPVAFVIMRNWLDDFAYHIQMGWVVFAITLALSLGFAWFTVAFKAVKAARANPIHAIREE